MSAALVLHALSAIVWVGGMYFALLVLRPAAGDLEPAARLALWGRAFSRFFPWVWGSIVLLPATGYWLIFGIWEGLGAAPLHVQVMHWLGWLMVLIYLHLWFAPYRRFKAALAAGELPVAANQLNQIRWIVTTNLVLGLITAGVGASGRFWS